MIIAKLQIILPQYISSYGVIFNKHILSTLDRKCCFYYIYVKIYCYETFFVLLSSNDIGAYKIQYRSSFNLHHAMLMVIYLSWGILALNT